MSVPVDRELTKRSSPSNLADVQRLLSALGLAVLLSLIAPARALAQTGEPAHVASAAPSASAAPGEHGPEPAATAGVRLMDKRVFEVLVARGGQSAEERARAASQVLERAAEQKEPPEVRVEESAGVAVVYLGARPLIQLGPEDAAAAGDSSLSIHAASVAGKVRDALAKERSRSEAATTVFSFSLLVFSGLIALLLLRKVRELVEKARAWIGKHPDRLPVLRVQGIEVLRPAAFQGAIRVSLSIARVLAQLGITYSWLLFSLSLFEATSGYSERLTGFVLAPVSALMGRVASALPVLVIAAIAALAVLVLVRFTGLFFGSIARGETSLGGLPTDLAIPTGFVVRFAIVVAALVLAGPLVTGAEEGALARAGVVVLVALGLASTPILASVAVGIAVVYGRRVRVGDVAEVGGRSGRVIELSLLEVRLEDEDGCDVRVPHLSSLIHPMRVIGKSPLVAIEISVAPDASVGRAREVIAEAVKGIGTPAKVTLIDFDAAGAHFRATTFSDANDARDRWLTAILEGLGSAGVPLARPRRPQARSEAAP